jgi:ABC-type phosphate/phosphonate transport system substrate-binding protein
MTGNRRFARTVGLVVSVAAALAVAQAQDQAPRRAAVLRYAISVSAMSEVNPSDALAATLVWAKAIGQGVGSWGDAEARLVEDSAAAVRIVNADATDLIALSSLEYLGIEHAMHAEPALAYIQGADRPGTELVLLARGGSVRSVADLKGKRVGYFTPSNQRDLADTWLDVLLMEAGLGTKERALAQAKPFKKRSQAALALFFDQVDAAIEPRYAFAAATELNPQLGKDLRVLLESPRLLPGLVCLRSSLDPELRRQIMTRATELHTLAKYRQTFMMMRATRLVPWDPRFLDGTRALMAKYDALRRQQGR